MSQDITLLEEISEQNLEDISGGIFSPPPMAPTVVDKNNGIDLSGLSYKISSSRA